MHQKDIYRPDMKYYQLIKLELKENDNMIFHVQTIECVTTKEKTVSLGLIFLFIRKFFMKNMKNKRIYS